VVVIARPVIESVSVSGETVTIVWSAIDGKTYRVQYKDSLDAVTWTDLPPPDVIASGPTASATDSINSAEQRFYRVLVVP